MKIKDLKDLIANLPDDADVLIRNGDTTALASGFPGNAACIKTNPDRRFAVVDNNTPDWLDASSSGGVSDGR